MPKKVLAFGDTKFHLLGALGLRSEAIRAYKYVDSSNLVSKSMELYMFDLGTLSYPFLRLVFSVFLMLVGLGVIPVLS